MKSSSKSCMLIHVSRDSTLYNTFTYPAGETQVRFNAEGLELLERADEVRIVARIQSAQDFMELALLVDAVYNFGSNDLDIYAYLPYFPYGRADRTFMEGDCHGLRTFTTLLSSLAVRKVYTLDIHSTKYTSPMVTSVPPITFITRSIFDFALRTDSKDLVILFPDEGAKERYAFGDGCVAAHSTTIKTHTYFATKKRDLTTGKLLGFEVPELPVNIPILIVDDLCDGGGTFNGISKEVWKTGNKAQKALYVTHGIFSQSFNELTVNFERIYTTDSFREDIAHPRVTVFHAEDVLLKAK